MMMTTQSLFSKKLAIHKPASEKTPVISSATIPVVPWYIVPARNKLIGNVAVRYVYWSGELFIVVLEVVTDSDARNNVTVRATIDPTQKIGDINRPDNKHLGKLTGKHSGKRVDKSAGKSSADKPGNNSSYKYTFDDCGTQPGGFASICAKIIGKISARIRELREIAGLSDTEIYFCIRKECKV